MEYLWLVKCFNFKNIIICFQPLCNLPYTHCTQYVQKDERAVSIIITRQVPVAQSLDP